MGRRELFSSQILNLLDKLDLKFRSPLRQSHHSLSEKAHIDVAVRSLCQLLFDLGRLKYILLSTSTSLTSPPGRPGRLDRGR